MNILALDTSGPVLAVAAASKEGLIVETHVRGALNHSENLLSLIDSVLKVLCLEIHSIDLFACGLGPGSFTGLRVGLALLKGMVVATGKPCYGFSSLDLVAQNLLLEDGRAAVLVDAKREKIYAAFYRYERGRPVKESDDLVLGLDEILERAQGKILLTGDALKSYGDSLRKNLPQAFLLEKNFWFPRGEHLIQSLRSRYKEMKPLSLKDIRPRYLRLSEAEEKRLKSEDRNGDDRTSPSGSTEDRTLLMDRG